MGGCAECLTNVIILYFVSCCISLVLRSGWTIKSSSSVIKIIVLINSLLSPATLLFVTQMLGVRLDVLDHSYLIFQLGNVTTCLESEGIEFYLLIALLFVVQMQCSVIMPLEVYLASICITPNVEPPFISSFLPVPPFSRDALNSLNEQDQGPTLHESLLQGRTIFDDC